MFYLLLALLSSTFVSLMIRFSKNYSRNNYGLLAMNYFICMILASKISVNVVVFKQGFTTTILLAFISGILYMISFLTLQSNIHTNGLVYSSLFSKLGLVVAIVLSILFFKEVPTIFSILGILLAIIGIIYLNHSDESITNLKMLILLLITNGVTDSMSKIFSELGNSNNNDSYLFYTFFFAFLTTCIFLFKNKQRIEKEEIIFGILVGIPNYFSSKFLLQSLNYLKAIIVYPICSVGTIILISLCGIILFKEKLSKRAMVAYLMMLAAILLLNI